MSDMKSKKHITDLAFRWSPIGRENALVVRDGELEVKVLEALEPHLTTLTALSFQYYSGDVFPKWMISRLDMFGLHRASRLVGVELPSLVNLYIRRCPRLREVSMAAPKLTFLQVIDCQELKLTAIALFATLQDKTSVNLMTQLEYLLTDRSQLKCLPLLIQAADDHHGVPLKLKNLTVMEGQDDKTTFPMLLRNLTSLETLEICVFSEAQLLLLDDDNQESFPSSLTKLVLSSCENLTCLPKALRNCTSLKDLHIWHCPQLTSFEEELLPTSLTTFKIYFCENLIQLPKDLYNLTSLVTLHVRGCPQIEVRPDDRFPPSLHKFSVSDCPKLEQQLEQECRTDWPVLDFILKSRMS